jgi:hypothetical protein
VNGQFHREKFHCSYSFNSKRTEYKHKRYWLLLDTLILTGSNAAKICHEDPANEYPTGEKGKLFEAVKITANGQGNEYILQKWLVGWQLSTSVLACRFKAGG